MTCGAVQEKKNQKKYIFRDFALVSLPFFLSPSLFSSFSLSLPFDSLPLHFTFSGYFLLPSSKFSPGEILRKRKKMVERESKKDREKGKRKTPSFFSSHPLFLPPHVFVFLLPASFGSDINTTNMHLTLSFFTSFFLFLSLFVSPFFSLSLSYSFYLFLSLLFSFSLSLFTLPLLFQEKM